MSLSEINDFIITNPYLGYLLLSFFIIFLLIDNLAKNLTFYSKLRSAIYMPLARKLRFKFIQKAAIKADIQGKINEVLDAIKPELPQSGIKPLELKWVNKETVDNFIRDNKILIRIRPIENQDENLLNVSQPYLESVLIPKSRLLLNNAQKKAIIHFTTKEVIGNNKSLINKFHDEYYLPDCKSYKSLEDYFKKIEFTYLRGLFFSIGLTAIESAAEKNRFKKTNLESDFDEILNHLVSFIENKNKLDIPTNDDIWRFLGSGITYGMLLVAHPDKAKNGKATPYVNRAKEHLKLTDILFVAFTNQEKYFGNQVTKAIEEQLEVILLDELKTKYDYRGAFNGIVKVYIKK